MQGLELDSLGALINKAKMMEESRNHVKAEKELVKSSLGKRSFGSYGSYGGWTYEVGSRCPCT